jgi:hypothetical protein
MFVPHRKHITSPLQAQQVNAIYRVLTIVHYVTITILDIFTRHFFCLKYWTKDWILSSASGGICLVGPSR